jgi:type II secretory pathway pseudopilin PulG
MRKQRGFTYLGVLIAVAVLGIGLSVASEVWVTNARRQRLEELEWIGQQYVQAIGSDYESSPGRVKTYPKSLQELLEDHRFLTKRRHLRRMYLNPLSGHADWEIVLAPDGGIKGLTVRSRMDDSTQKIERSFVFVEMVK